MKKSTIQYIPSLLVCTFVFLISIQTALAESRAPFTNLHQGFEKDTNGWYDRSTSGPLGWCGDISRVTRDDTTDIGPSAGKAYATVSTGICNEYWAASGVPFSAPYGPGPELAGAFNAWPRAGFVTDLDVYLDPAWSGTYEGNFQFVGTPANVIVQYAATIFEADYMPGDIHTGPHYFVDVEAVLGQNALSVAGHTVTEAGWHTFRFLFSDSDGAVQVDFELVDRTGGTLARVENIDPTNLLGPFRTPFTDPVETAGYATGWAWFFDIAHGLALPIDQHRQRPGK
jgi:hypothetical protein